MVSSAKFTSYPYGGRALGLSYVHYLNQTSNTVREETELSKLQKIQDLMQYLLRDDSTLKQKAVFNIEWELRRYCKNELQ